MAFRWYEKEAGKYGAEFASRRGAYSDLNIDPYAGRRIKSGHRQEDWQDILKHGERSDTAWGEVWQTNAREMRRSYAPLGDWAKRKEMDATTQHMWDATLGYSEASRRSTSVAKPEGYDSYQQGGYTAETRPASGMGSRGQTDTIYTKEGSQSLTSEQVASFGGYDSRIAESRTSALRDRDVAAAKWMAAYNKNLNIHERIGLSEKRQAYRQRFADMEIQRERTTAKKTRDILKTGTSGLSVGAGAGTGLGII